MKRRRKNKAPLIIEDHPENYNGFEFITLVKYNDQNYLTIIDNIVNNQIVAYVLDYCSQMNVDEYEVIRLANEWFENKKDKYQFSIDLSRMGKAREFSKIIKCFNVEYVSRVIGPVYTFNVSGPEKIKRRKKKPVPTYMGLTIKN